MQIQCELFCLRRIKTPAVLDVQRLFRPEADRKICVENVPVKLISGFFGRCYVYMNIISQKIFPVKPGTKSNLVFAVSHVFDASMYRLRDVEGYPAIFCFVMFFRQNEP